jgi:outer membrane biosynthesis protein TonB
MNQSPDGHESIVLRVVWMLVFVLVWQVAQFLLGALVVVQLIYRLVYGAPNAGLMSFGDSLSQYLAQIGRFGMFHTDLKPWPFAEWPTPRAADGEAPHNPMRAAYAVREPAPASVKPVVPATETVVKEPVAPAAVVEKAPVVEAAVVDEPTVEPLVVDPPEVKPVVDAHVEATAPVTPVPPAPSVPPVPPVPPAPPVSPPPPPAKPDTPADPLAPGAPPSPGPKP